MQDCDGLISIQIMKRVLAKLRPDLGTRYIKYRFNYCNSRNETLVRNNILSAFKVEYNQSDLADIRLTQHYLDNLNRLVLANGAKMIVVLVPFAGQIKGQLAGGYKAYGLSEGQTALGKPQQLMVVFLTNSEIPFVDMLPIFRNNSNQQLFGKRDKHLSRVGHRLIAETLYKFMNADLGSKRSLRSRVELL